MGSQTSKTVLELEHKNHSKEEKGGSSNSDTSWTDIEMIDGDLAVDCLGGVSEDPVSSLLSPVPQSTI